MTTDPYAAATAICNALNLDPNLITRIELELNAGEQPTLTVTRYITTTDYTQLSTTLEHYRLERTDTTP